MESVDSPDDLPLTGQPLEAAQQKKRWWIWGLGILFGLFVFSKVVHSGGSHHEATAHEVKNGAITGSALHHGTAAPASPKPSPSALPRDLRHIHNVCRRTRIFPFHEGCPSLDHCRSRWSGVPPNVALFGMPVWWRLGSLDGLHDPAAIGATTNIELRKEFHVEPKFVRDFVRLEDELGFKLNELMATNGHKGALTKLPTGDLFVSLGYLCCVEEHEIELSHAVLKRWVNHYNFHVPLHFSHLECWHDRPNAISTMLVADEASQRRLKHIYDAMSASLTGGAVPVVKSEEMMVPFHFSLVGYRTADNSTISPHIDQIADAVTLANKDLSFKVTLKMDPQLGEHFELH